MALYVHITDACNADAHNLKVEPQLRRTQQSIETTQNLSGFSYLSSAVLKKKIGRPFRLIAWQYALAEDQLIVFLRLLQRRRRDYRDLLEDISANPQPYDTDKLRSILTHMTAASPVPPRSVPNDEERAWLDAVFQEKVPTTDPFVFETRSWVDAMRENKLSPLYHQLLDQMTDLDKLHAATSHDAIHRIREGDIGIAYHYRPDLNSILLLRPLQGVSDKPPLDTYAKRLAEADDQTALCRMAARSYPLVIVLDRDAWLAIQGDEESNLALSPEEAQIIESINATSADGAAYPLFINGLAGSGKSTILQYLASAYVDFALRRSTQRLPIYLTSSTDLLKRARHTVRGLITTNHRRILEDKIDHAAIGSLLDQSFLTFRELRQSLLPPELQRSFRDDNRYVNYASFRRLWVDKFAKRPEARRLSVEVSWHVIRSLIKGIRSDWDDELTPEDFEELPRRRRSVSSDTYEQVYDVVWDKWYKPLCRQQGYWDDQDLTAQVLGAGVASKENRSAIFCDEAQDFTSADLDVIFQLSLYGRRDLLPYELRRVPIVFAGDPLQTVNPTGFRWDAVKRDFHDRFRATLEAGTKPSIEMQDRHLDFNYRSNAGIVRFCNMLQLARTALLERSDIRPQDYWWRDDSVPPTCFAIEDPATESCLRDHPEFVKLIDCHEGEETEYVESDLRLKRIVDRSEEGTYRNVMCPTRAKGLEFSAVVMYRFAERVAGNFHDLLDGTVDLTDPESRLPWEYFFNGLYVAASRARDRLIVVDSDDAIERFWKFASDPEVYDDLLRKIHERHIGDNKRDLWDNKCAHLLRGTPEAWDHGHIDQRAQAEGYAAQGRREGDPYLLRQAGLSFRSVNEDYKARTCFANATELEGNWKTAGDRYGELRLYDDALRCYWKGRVWRPLKQLAVRANWVDRLESRAADFMASAGGPPLSLLDRLHAAAKDETRLREISHDPTWQHVLVLAADRVASDVDDGAISWPELFATFNVFRHEGVGLNPSSLAIIAFRGHCFQMAVELWERDNQIQSTEYRRAKAYTTPFPECLELFGKIGDEAEIMRRWNDEHPSDPAIRALSPKIAHTVADAALDRGEHAVVVKMMHAHPERERVGRLLASAVKARDDSTVCEGALVAARLFVRSGAWTDVVDADTLISIGRLAGIAAAEIRAALDRQERGNDVLEAVVWQLATSENLAKDAPAAVASFLQRRFIARNTAQGSGMRNHGIPANVIGAAIERSGKIIDALQYYDNLLEDVRESRATRRFAAERLVCNLERHSRHLERRESRESRLQAQKQWTKADLVRRIWRIEDRYLDDYPVVGKPRADKDRGLTRSESPHSFWDSPTLEALASSQNVAPVSDVEDLFGTWPGDESDGFEAAVDALRHPDSAHENS